ncbi:MAG: hypothetical protein NVSMB42_25580 [Herpetosiphon sp.]
MTSPVQGTLSRWLPVFETLGSKGTDIQDLLIVALQALVAAWPARGAVADFRVAGGERQHVVWGEFPAQALRRPSQEPQSDKAANVPSDVQRWPLGSTTVYGVPLDGGDVFDGSVYVLADTGTGYAEDLGQVGLWLGAAIVRIVQGTEDTVSPAAEAGIAHCDEDESKMKALSSELRRLLQVDAAAVLLVNEQRTRLIGDGRRGAVDDAVPWDVLDDVSSRRGAPYFMARSAGTLPLLEYLEQQFDCIVQTVAVVPWNDLVGEPAVLLAINPQGRDAFSAHDLDVAVLLAGQAAGAIENAKLRSMLQTERKRLIRHEAEIREYIGRNLHDGPVQQVSAAVMHVHFVQAVLRKAPEQAGQAFRDLEAQLQKAIQDLRTVLYELRPPGLEENGLYVVLQRYVEQSRDPAGSLLTLKMPPEPRRLAADQEAPTLIIIQEAVNNARKHAQASKVQIEVQQDAEALIITVCDNGKGFDLEARKSSPRRHDSWGMRTMSERAVMIGGEVQVTSSPGAGTTVHIRIPFET